MRVGRALGLGLQERFEGHRDARAGEGQETVGLWESLVCPLGKSGITKVLDPEKRTSPPHWYTSGPCGPCPWDQGPPLSGEPTRSPSAGTGNTLKKTRLTYDTHVT